MKNGRKQGQEQIEAFYRNVRLLIKSNGMKIGDVERSINTDPGYLCKAEKAKSEIGIIKAKRLADMFNVSIEDLMSKDYANEYEKQLIVQEMEKLKARYEELEQK